MANINKIYILPMYDNKDYLCDYAYQTAKTLGKRDIVIIPYYSVPITIFTLLKNISRLKRLILEWISIIQSENPGIYECEFISFIPLQRFWYVFILNRRLTWLQLAFLLWVKKILYKDKNTIVLWNLHPTLEFYVNKLGETISLYDCVDYYETWPIKEKSTIKAEESLINKVNLVFANSKKLASRINDKRNAKVVPCGCAIDEFPNNFTSKKNLQIKIKKPLVGFFGYIDYRINYDLMRYLVANNKNIQFIFIGKILTDLGRNNINLNINVSTGIRNLKKYHNFYLLSSVPKKDLKYFLYHFDITIIPYSIKHKFVYYSNPMKFYEYLAMGVPVVSTPIPSLLIYKLPTIRFGKTKEEFNDNIKYLLEHPYLKQEYKMQMRKIAEDNSWEKKVGEIQKCINEEIRNSKS